MKKLKGMLMVGVVTVSAMSEMTLAQGNRKEVDRVRVVGHVCNQSGFKNECEVDIGTVEGNLVIDGKHINPDSLKGATGDKGAKGDRGKQGIQGERGLAGKDGVDGLTGAEGAKGEQGERGEQGVAGINGVDGKDGVDADMSVVEGNTEAISTNTTSITSNSTAITQESLERQAAIEELNQDLNSFNAELNSVNAYHTSWNEAQDLQISKINREIYGLKQDIVDLNDGVAMAIAGNNLIQATNGGNTLSMSFGTYGSQSAVALGASANFGNQNRWTTRMNFSVTERNHGFGAGVGYEF